jgi:hypothetical protein
VFGVALLATTPQVPGNRSRPDRHQDKEPAEHCFAQTPFLPAVIAGFDPRLSGRIFAASVSGFQPLASSELVGYAGAATNHFITDLYGLMRGFARNARAAIRVTGAADADARSFLALRAVVPVRRYLNHSRAPLRLQVIEPRNHLRGAPKKCWGRGGWRPPARAAALRFRENPCVNPCASVMKGFQTAPTAPPI